jgi:hypothetical protein
MQKSLYLTCPICGAQIPFDPHALIRGERFACPSCPDVSIGLDEGSRDRVKTTLHKLDRLRTATEETRSERRRS